MVAAAVIGGAVLSAGIGAAASSSAADTQAQSAANAQAISQNEFNTITAQEQPFMQSGYDAQAALNYGLGIGQPTDNSGGGYDPATGFRIGAGGGISQLIPGGGMGSLGGARVPTGGSSTGLPGGAQGTGLGYGSLLSPFTASMMQQYSPAYQFQKQQGMQGVLNSDTGSVGALSGAASKDLIDYNQNLANTAFNNAFNQYQTQQGNIYQRLAGVAQLGQASAANTGQQGTALAGQAAQSATNIGTAQAAGQIGVANAISGATGSLPWLAYGGGGTPNAAGSYNSVMNSGNFGGPNAYGSGYTFEDYGATP